MYSQAHLGSLGDYMYLCQLLTMYTTRSLLPTWSVPLVSQLVLVHALCFVPQTDAQGLKKKQCSLGDLPGVWENCISRGHFSVNWTRPLFACVKFQIVSSYLGTSFAWKCQSHDASRQAGQWEQNPSPSLLCVRAYNAMVWITVGWYTSCNRLQSVYYINCASLYTYLRHCLAKQSIWAIHHRKFSNWSSAFWATKPAM